MFSKRKKRKEALERLKKLVKEANAPLNPIKFAYKQQQLLYEIGNILSSLLQGNL